DPLVAKLAGFGGVEGEPGGFGHGAGNLRLACAWRPVQDDSVRQVLPPLTFVLFGVREEKLHGDQLLERLGREYEFFREDAFEVLAVDAGVGSSGVVRAVGVWGRLAVGSDEGGGA